jgi:hypothetical protein
MSPPRTTRPPGCSRTLLAASITKSVVLGFVFSADSEAVSPGWS